jgi:hypothetical protein
MFPGRGNRGGPLLRRDRVRPRAAVVAAFGATFAYPVLQAVAERRSPRSLPFMWRSLTRIDLALLTPGAILVLLAGIYLVVSSDGPWDWGR